MDSVLNFYQRFSYIAFIFFKKLCNSGNPPLVSIPIKHDVETLASRGTGTKYAFHTYIVEVSAVIAEHEVV